MCRHPILPYTLTWTLLLGSCHFRSLYSTVNIDFALSSEQNLICLYARLLRSQPFDALEAYSMHAHADAKEDHETTYAGDSGRGDIVSTQRRAERWTECSLRNRCFPVLPL